jgi:hypothetical protein
VKANQKEEEIMEIQTADIYHQISVLQQALSSNKNKVAFLLGAGCSTAIRVKDESGQTCALIPAVVGLTDNVKEKLEDLKIEAICSRLRNSSTTEPNIEEILSHVRLLQQVVGGGNIDNLNKKDLEKLEEAICEEITNAVKKDLPNEQTPHHNLAAWIGAVSRDHPVEIFTPNYDTLIEQALESINVPYFDGFVGACNAFFDLHTMENDTLPPRWTRLWKLHGSINWWRDEKGNVYRSSGNECSYAQQMIYPSHLKYDQSRRMPYLAMLDRLGKFLSEGQSILITCGYSFADQHLNDVIIQRLGANPRAVCFGLLFGEMDKYHLAKDCAMKRANLNLISKDSSFIGTCKRTWKNGIKSDHEACEVGAACTENEGCAEEKVVCKLGNFDVLGRFLASQLGPYEKIKEMNDE